MKKNLIILSLAAMFSLAAEAQDKISLNFGETPKREVRAVWLTTVKSLDWPDTKANSPENIKRQQKELTDPDTTLCNSPSSNVTPEECRFTRGW